MPTRVLDEFKDFVTSLGSLKGMVAVIALSAPIADLLANFGPPWPSRLAVVSLVIAVEIFIIMYLFSETVQSTTSVTRLKRLVAISGSSAIFFVLFVYTPLFLSFVQDAHSQWSRIVIGYELEDSIKATINEAKSSKDVDIRSIVWTPKVLISKFIDGETDETSIWTRSSVLVCRFIVLITWLLFTTSYSILIVSFLCLQYKRHKTKSPT